MVVKKIIVLLMLFCINIYGQNNSDSVFILKDDNININVLQENVYNIHLNIKSIDTSFKFDTYNFQIISPGFETLSLDKFKKEIDVKHKKIYTYKDLSKLDPCDLHKFLSSNLIYLLDSENKVNYCWRMQYTGTSKDIITTTK